VTKALCELPRETGHPVAASNRRPRNRETETQGRRRSIEATEILRALGDSAVVSALLRVFGVLALLLAGLILITLNGCATMQVAGTWRTASPTAINSDDEEPEWTYVNDGNMLIAASNDSDYLHVTVRFRTVDTKWARSCAMSGLMVWLDATGKKKRDFGIRIASGPELKEGGMPNERPGGGDKQSGVTGREFSPPGAPPRLDGNLTVQYPDHQVAARADGSSGLRARFESESGVCTYDLAVPVRAISEDRLGLSLKPGSTVMVGLTAGPSEEERAAMRERARGMRGREGGTEGPSDGGMDGPSGGGMGGGPPGGGMGGGRPGGGPGGAGRSGTEMQENPEIWVKLQLARAAAPTTRK
jgi:hypothetical protein